MNTLRHHQPNFERTLRGLAAGSSLFDPQIEERTRAIVEEVRHRGDQALAELTERFDGAKIAPAQFAVSAAELMEASLTVSHAFRKAVRAARANIEQFSRRGLRRNWRAKNRQGVWVGEKFDPIERVGIYVPGGAAPLVSTALMTAVLAAVAGCPEIVVCSPAGRDGRLNPALLFAARAAGATEIYRVGGAQAIAAMVFGTETIRPVRKIFGPGNAYVVAAKRLLFGRVAVDLLPGPSEALVLADDTANPRWAASDLLAQAEHGSGQERVWLVTSSLRLLQGVEKEIARQLPQLARRELAEKALRAHGWLIHARDLDMAIAIANQIAPEHCEIMTRHPEAVAQRIRHAGAIFIGGASPTVLGDYLAGPSHTLPTGGAAAAFAGLTVDQFQRRSSLVQCDAAALKKSRPFLEEFARMEGLDAHAQSAAIRQAGAARAKRAA